MSPYLFRMVVEIFNQTIKKKIIENGMFKYHGGCAEKKLTHLCFACHILVLCNGEVYSIKYA